MPFGPVGCSAFVAVQSSFLRVTFGLLFVFCQFPFIHMSDFLFLFSFGISFNFSYMYSCIASVIASMDMSLFSDLLFTS